MQSTMGGFNLCLTLKREKAFLKTNGSHQLQKKRIEIQTQVRQRPGVYLMLYETLNHPSSLSSAAYRI